MDSDWSGIKPFHWGFMDLGYFTAFVVAPEWYFMWVSLFHCVCCGPWMIFHVGITISLRLLWPWMIFHVGITIHCVCCGPEWYFMWVSLSLLISLLSWWWKFVYFIFRHWRRLCSSPVHFSRAFSFLCVRLVAFIVLHFLWLLVYLDTKIYTFVYCLTGHEVVFFVIGFTLSLSLWGNNLELSERFLLCDQLENSAPRDEFTTVTVSTAVLWCVIISQGTVLWANKFAMITVWATSVVFYDQSGDCTLREATIISSVLREQSLPVHHAGAAIDLIASMEYSGASSIFLRTLLEKKFALPYSVVDAVVTHFVRWVCQLLLNNNNDNKRVFFSAKSCP